MTSSEPTVLPHQQPKKRRRKDFAKGNCENKGGCSPNKQKAVKMEAAKNPITSAQSVGVTRGDMKFQNQPNASGVGTKRKAFDSKVVSDTFFQISNGDASAHLAEVKNIDRQNTTRTLSKDTSNKSKDVIVSSDASQLKYHERNSYAQPKSHSGRSSSSVGGLESTVCAREKNGIPLLPDLNAIGGKYTTATIVRVL